MFIAEKPDSCNSMKAAATCAVLYAALTLASLLVSDIRHIITHYEAM